jgi:hypothetical protein
MDKNGYTRINVLAITLLSRTKETPVHLYAIALSREHKIGGGVGRFNKCSRLRTSDKWLSLFAWQSTGNTQRSRQQVCL